MPSKALPLVIVELNHFFFQGYSAVGLHSPNPGKAFWHILTGIKKRFSSLPAKYKVSIKAATIHPSVLRKGCPAGQP